MNKNLSKSAKRQHKSVDSAVLKYNVSSSRNLIPKMSNRQANIMVSRLTENVQGRNENYSTWLNQKVIQLNLKRQKMGATIDLFRLMHSNDMSVRCLHHNNQFTLYCVTEHKVLCVNCTYGDGKHRTHKVLPLKDSGQFIAKDNQQLGQKISNDLKTLKQSMRVMALNVKALRKGLDQVLKQMEGDYNQKIAELTTRYEGAVKKVQDNFMTLIDKSLTMMNDIGGFKSKLESAIASITMSAQQSSEGEVVKQVCSSNFSQLSKFQIELITTSQMKRMTHPVQF